MDAPASAYSIVAINGLKPSMRRGVVFLCALDGSLNGEPIFRERENASKPALAKHARTLKDRFDFWIDGGHRDNWFHGWPNNPEYKDCFVFKWNERNIDQRLYGFLHHPMPINGPGFQLCVLHTHDAKTEKNTESSHLILSVGLKEKVEVLKAIAVACPDIRK